MLLQRLVEFHDRMKSELVPPHHKPRDIHCIVDLSRQGEFRGFVRTGGDEKPLKKPAPYRKRTSGITPYLLVDRPDYALGVAQEGKEDRTRKCHRAFIELMKEVAEKCEVPELDAIICFLEDQADEALSQLPDTVASQHLVTFTVDGIYPIELPEVQRAWIEIRNSQGKESSSRTGTCMICENERPIAKRMPVEQRLGPDQAPLITANKSAFQSYGQDASEVASLCLACAQKFGMALSYLRKSERHRYTTGSVVHLFWTREPHGFSPVSFLNDAESQDVRELLQSPHKGKDPAGITEDAFYALSVEGARKRMVVRNWIETTVPQVKDNLCDYFTFQRMVGTEGEDSYYPLKVLAFSLARDNRSIPVQAEDALLACAIQGSPMPTQVLHQAITRARADSENRMTRPRAALIRLVFESQRSHGLIPEDSEVTAELNTENRNPAYLCGRLLAVLERIQNLAIGPKTTIVDRYFGTASSAPATVFGKLMRGAQNHLGKLRKEKKGAYHGLDRQLQEICTELPEFPRTLSLQEQALFSLGYYQQKASDRRQAAERREAKND